MELVRTIVWDEVKYAKEHLRDNDIGQSLYYTLTAIAKYYYWCEGFKKKQTVKLLFEFLSRSYPRYEMNEADWKVTVDKIADKAKRSKPYEISGVKVTKTEMQKIEAIHNRLLERLIFTMLCVAKLNNAKNEKNRGWVNLGSKEIFKCARISCGAEEREIKIGQLWQMGLLEFSKRNDNLNCRVTFIDDDSEEALFVDDFRELGYEYRKYKGEPFIRCAECNILTPADKAGNKKYCRNCSAYTPMNMKIITCIDCGTEFAVDARNNRTRRCPACYTTYRAQRKAETQRMRREKDK